ncbi:protein of unknown function [Rhodovastum atsumiense]|nr:protein of unknown function [Rhodovastum atsumiense]
MGGKRKTPPSFDLTRGEVRKRVEKGARSSVPAPRPMHRPARPSGQVPIGFQPHARHTGPESIRRPHRSNANGRAAKQPAPALAAETERPRPGVAAGLGRGWEAALRRNRRGRCRRRTEQEAGSAE